MGDEANSDLAISQEAVDRIVKGLRSTIAELSEVGSSETDKLQGAGFSQLSLAHMEVGHHRLTQSFERYCETWEWGVRGLVQEVNWLAEQLGLAAGLHYETDRYRATTFKVAGNALNPLGNPYASERELAKQDWGDIATPDAPDFTGESVSGPEAFTKPWEKTGDNLSSKGWGGLVADHANAMSQINDGW